MAKNGVGGSEPGFVPVSNWPTDPQLPPSPWSHLDAAYSRIDPDDVPPGPWTTVVLFGFCLFMVPYFLFGLQDSLGPGEPMSFWTWVGALVFPTIFLLNLMLMLRSKKAFRRKYPDYDTWDRDYRRRRQEVRRNARRKRTD